MNDISSNPHLRERSPAGVVQAPGREQEGHCSPGRAWLGENAGAERPYEPLFYGDSNVAGSRPSLLPSLLHKAPYTNRRHKLES